MFLFFKAVILGAVNELLYMSVDECSGLLLELACCGICEVLSVKFVLQLPLSSCIPRAWKQKRSRSFIAGSHRRSECCCEIVGCAVEDTGGLISGCSALIEDLSAGIISGTLMSLTNPNIQNGEGVDGV